MSLGGRLFLALAALTAAMMPMALSAEPTDTAVKAAFLPRFARYVTWPAAAMPKGSDPFVLCVIGADPFGSQLDDAARSQLIDGRRIVVRRLASASGADGCQIAFVAAARTSFGLAALAGKPVLTVTDSNSSGQRGIIHFVVEGGRVRFFIDQAAASQRGLTISSRLLALAIGVAQ
jgi:YfiR/HmsC-like